MKWKIEVSDKPGTPDAAGQGILQDIADLGIDGVRSVRTAHVYWVEGDIAAPALERICSELLADPVTQQYVYRTVDDSVGESNEGAGQTIEVRFKPGVTDAVGDSVRKGIDDLGITGVQAAHTGQKYWIQGDLDPTTLQIIAQRLLANEVIQTFTLK